VFDPKSAADLRDEIDDISRHLKCLQDELVPMSEQIAVGTTDASLPEKHARMVAIIAHLKERKERLLKRMATDQGNGADQAVATRRKMA
jgi:hypothetical protein